MQKEYLILFFFAINLLAGLFVFWKEKNKKIGAHFLASVLILNFLTVFLFFYQSQILLSSASWARLIIASAIVLFLELLFFIVVLSKKSLWNLRVILATLALLSTITICAFFLNRIMSLAAFFSPLAALFVFLFLYVVWLGMIFFEKILKKEN